MQATSSVASGAVDYVAPETLSEALRILHQHGEAAKVLAGGQSLLVFLREGLIAPRVLVSLKRVQELRALSFSVADGMHIGAMVTQVELERAQPVRDYYRALSEAANVVATVQVRNQGTIGGNLCHADPTADPPAALIALGARLEIAGLDGLRTLPVEEFFRDYMDVDLSHGPSYGHTLTWGEKDKPSESLHPSLRAPAAAWSGDKTMTDAIQAQADKQVAAGKPDRSRPEDVTHENPAGSK